MLLCAKWVIPIIGEPILNGALHISDDTITRLGTREELKKDLPRECEIDFGQAVIMPGFVNTHTHIELSVLHGLIKPSPFTPWILQLIEKARKLSLKDWEISASFGACMSIKSGITCIGDIATRSPNLKALCESGLRGIVFAEVIEMDEAKIDDAIVNVTHKVELWKDECKGSLLNIGIAPHSLYTVHPLLIKKLSRWARREGLPLSMHLAESQDETLYVRDGKGGLAQQYRQFLGWAHLPVKGTGVSPTRYAEQLGVLDGLIAAHSVQVNREDIPLLKDHNVTVAHCPQSNSYLKVGIAPVIDLMNKGIPVGLGTDSLASNEDMDFFKEMRRLYLSQWEKTGTAKTILHRKMLEIATLGGARVLKVENKVGSLEVGKQADVIAVKPSRPIHLTEDLFSYLVDEARNEDVIFNMVAGKTLFHEGIRLIPDMEEITTQMKNIQLYHLSALK
ncbi:MAG: amidohydrolase family protein [Thermodesulfobacteriota bacterium]|nr:amidohydrolase family protein [Thermodesulfobacteriota bacterium]